MKRKLVPRSLWKRTYVPGIFWQGVGNNYSYNTVTNGPHNCMLGGGNEDWPWGLGNMEVGSGSQCVFEGNTLDTCAYECGDCGAFYTCGQGGSAWVNRGNVVLSPSSLDEATMPRWFFCTHCILRKYSGQTFIVSLCCFLQSARL